MKLLNTLLLFRLALQGLASIRRDPLFHEFQCGLQGLCPPRRSVLLSVKMEKYVVLCVFGFELPKGNSTVASFVFSADRLGCSEGLAKLLDTCPRVAGFALPKIGQ